MLNSPFGVHQEYHGLAITFYLPAERLPAADRCWLAPRSLNDQPHGIRPARSRMLLVCPHLESLESRVCNVQCRG